MTTHACTVCHAPIPPGLAHLRSVSFEQVAWCDPCWHLRAEVESAFIPAQRTTTDERVNR